MSERMRFETLSQFCERLINDVEHYRCDLFTTYEELLKCQEGTHGIVLTRKNGCEFYSQESSKEVLERYNTYRHEAVNFYHIQRDHEDCYFGRFPAVSWEIVSQEHADILMRIIAKGYTIYCSEGIRELLSEGYKDFVPANKLTEGDLDKKGERAWLLVDDLVGDADYLSRETLDALYVDALKYLISNEVKND